MRAKNLKRYNSNRKKSKAVVVSSNIISSKVKIRFTSKSITQNNNINLLFECDWVNIYFEDGYINFKNGNLLFSKCYKEAQKSLNYIKRHYVHRNVPKLLIKVEAGIITNIENEDSLYFHIKFLKSISFNFNNSEEASFFCSNWRKYTKGFYNTKLPHVFTTDSLNYLCEISYQNLPIIPVGEVIINNNLQKEIHMSFMFPIKIKKGFLIIWESTFHFKASYIFSINSYDDSELQPIFNYIAGPLMNKRLTLINSKSIQKNLKFKKRISHKGFDYWLNNIEEYFNSCL